MIKKIKDNKALNILFKIFKAGVSLIIILIVSVIFVQRVSDNKVTLGGYSIFTVVTESMVPVYGVGDMIIAKTVDIEDVKIGDDVVYLGKEDSFKDKIVTHRVVDIEKDSSEYVFHTKGVANNYEDPLIGYDQIYGKVLYRCKLLSFLSKIVNNTYGFYFVVFIPFVIMIFLEVIDVINDKEKLKG